MAHDHDHSHHAPESYNFAFAIAVGLNFGFILIEAFYAVMANSMSLLADAGHNLGDVAGLLLAWGANYLLTRRSGERYSYGYKKTTIFAALMNALLLVGTSAVIAYESIHKLINPLQVNEGIIIVIALIGILVNGGTALLFMRGSSDDLNIKGAFLHLAYDALISFGVVVTGIIIWYSNWNWLDPVAGLMIVVTILLGTWGLLRNSVNLMLDAVPHHINMTEIKTYLKNIPGVVAIHDLHIWGLSTRECALTTHLVIPDGHLSDEDYKKINHDLLHQYKIHHVTIQVEKGTAEDVCGQEVCE